MKILAVICSVLAVAISIPAQSGRRIEPSPTPLPIVQEDPATYSESAAQRKRPVQVWPSLRGDGTPKLGTSPTLVNGKTAADPATPTVSDGEDVQKVETNLVTIPVSVFDRHGLYIPNLKQDDFKIFEDG